MHSVKHINLRKIFDERLNRTQVPALPTHDPAHSPSAAGDAELTLEAVLTRLATGRSVFQVRNLLAEAQKGSPHGPVGRCLQAHQCAQRLSEPSTCRALRELAASNERANQEFAETKSDVEYSVGKLRLFREVMERNVGIEEAIELAGLSNLKEAKERRKKCGKLKGIVKELKREINDKIKERKARKSQFNLVIPDHIVVSTARSIKDEQQLTPVKRKESMSSLSYFKPLFSSGRGEKSVEAEHDNCKGLAFSNSNQNRGFVMSNGDGSNHPPSIQGSRFELNRSIGLSFRHNLSRALDDPDFDFNRN